MTQWKVRGDPNVRGDSDISFTESLLRVVLRGGYVKVGKGVGVKNGRVRRVPLTNPIKCPDCDGLGWPTQVDDPRYPGIPTLNWDWPCQTCDTEGEVEG